MQIFLSRRCVALRNAMCFLLPALYSILCTLYASKSYIRVLQQRPVKVDAKSTNEGQRPVAATTIPLRSAPTPRAVCYSCWVLLAATVVLRTEVTADISSWLHFEHLDMRCACIHCALYTLCPVHATHGLCPAATRAHPVAYLLCLFALFTSRAA
jgi:hypothetical protein